MILIFSIQEDVTTRSVIDWLTHYKKELLVIYPDSDVEIDNILIKEKDGIDFTLTKRQDGKEFKVNYSKISSVWFRRGKLSPKNFKIQSQKITENVIIQTAIKNHLNFEYSSTIDFIYELLCIEN